MSYLALKSIYLKLKEMSGGNKLYCQVDGKLVKCSHDKDCKKSHLLCVPGKIDDFQNYDLYEIDPKECAQAKEIKGKDSSHLCNVQFIEREFGYLPWPNPHNPKNPLSLEQINDHNIRSLHCMQNIVKSICVLYSNKINIFHEEVRERIRVYYSDNKSVTLVTKNDIGTIKSVVDKSIYHPRNIAISIIGKVSLRGDARWTPYKRDELKEVIYNYTIAPVAHDLSAINDYKKAVFLGMQSMYKSILNFKTNVTKIALVWNPFGMGAFNRIKDINEKEMYNELCITTLFDEYNKLVSSVKNIEIRLVFVSGNFINDEKAKRILTTFDDNLSRNFLLDIYTEGDMLDIAVEYSNKGYNTTVSMAGDKYGPGNHFYNFPTYSDVKEGKYARTASDENNTRRSDIIHIVFLLQIMRLPSQKFQDDTIGKFIVQLTSLNEKKQQLDFLVYKKQRNKIYRSIYIYIEEQYSSKPTRNQFISKYYAMVNEMYETHKNSTILDRIYLNY